jgi:hypothetical protein
LGFQFSFLRNNFCTWCQQAISGPWEARVRDDPRAIGTLP